LNFNLEAFELILLFFSFLFFFIIDKKKIVLLILVGNFEGERNRRRNRK